MVQKAVLLAALLEFPESCLLLVLLQQCCSSNGSNLGDSHSELISASAARLAQIQASGSDLVVLSV